MEKKLAQAFVGTGPWHKAAGVGLFPLRISKPQDPAVQFPPTCRAGCQRRSHGQRGREPQSLAGVFVRPNHILRRECCGCRWRSQIGVSSALVASSLIFPVPLLLSVGTVGPRDPPLAQPLCLCTGWASAGSTVPALLTLGNPAQMCRRPPVIASLDTLSSRCAPAVPCNGLRWHFPQCPTTGHAMHTQL